MRRVLFYTCVVVLILWLAGCTTTSKPQPNFQLIEVPVPSWPEPAIITLSKQGGIEYISDTSPPGEVAKQYHYEAVYWKNQSELYRRELEMYKHENYSIKSLEQIMLELRNEK